MHHHDGRETRGQDLNAAGRMLHEILVKTAPPSRLIIVCAELCSMHASSKPWVSWPLGPGTSKQAMDVRPCVFSKTCVCDVHHGPRICLGVHVWRSKFPATQVLGGKGHLNQAARAEFGQTSWTNQTLSMLPLHPSRQTEPCLTLSAARVCAGCL